MRKVILAGLVLILSFQMSGQEISKKEQRKLDKQMRVEQKAEEAAQKARSIAALVDSKRLVLEANNIRIGHNNEKVNADLNFVVIDVERSAFQVGSGEWIGDNGVGGLTVEGKVEQFTHSYNDKKGMHTLKWFIHSSAGRYSITMYVADSGRGEARLRTSNGREIYYTGHIVSMEETTVFRGFARY